MRIHVTFDLYIPEGDATLEQATALIASGIEAAYEEWKPTNVDVEER